MEQSESHDFYRFKGVVLSFMVTSWSLDVQFKSWWFQPEKISVNLDQFPKAWGENKQISETTT